MPGLPGAPRVPSRQLPPCPRQPGLLPFLLSTLHLSFLNLLLLLLTPISEVQFYPFTPPNVTFNCSVSWVRIFNDPIKGSRTGESLGPLGLCTMLVT